MTGKRAIGGILAAALLLGGGARLGADERQDGEAMRTALAFESELVRLVERVRPAYVMIGGGSGVIISPDGHMLTNFHVAGSRKDWMVFLPSMKRYKAKMVGTDPRGDLCLLKIEGAAGPLPFVPLGDSDALRPGQRVLAIGNPWMVGRLDAQPLVSLGIVSALHVYRGNYTDAIQTDAPINPGNSGGPLINMAGELVGINGQVAVRFGTDRINTGIGFAIPANQIRAFMEPLKKGGEVQHGLLAGVGVDPAYLDGEGARVMQVDPASPAYRAGLRPNDRIVEVEGQRVTGRQRLYGILGIFPAGRELKLAVKRGAGRHEISVPLAGRVAVPSAPAAANPNAPVLGVQISQAYQGPGVEVEQVVPGSAAEKADLRAGDILLEMDGRKVENAPQLVQMIQSKKVGDPVKLKVKRGLDTLEVTATLARRPS